MSQYGTFLTLTGFYGWILSTIAFILKSFPSNGIFLNSKGIKSGLSVIFFFSLWIIGMLNA